jgi:hypothetical protein
VVETRQAIRELRIAAPEQFAALWGDAEGGALPDWPAVDRQIENTVVGWYETPTWAASEQFFAEHAAQLATRAAEIVLKELILLNPTHVGLHQHAHLLNLMRANGSADYHKLVAVARIYGLLDAWIATPDWRGSRAFFQECAEELAEPAVSVVLDDWAERDPDDRAVWVHRGILALARQAGVDDAYLAVVDPDNRQERLRTLTADEDGEALLPYAYLQLGLGDDPAAAWADLAVANLFAGQPEQADQAIERCRAAVAAAQRTALVSRLASLAAEHPAHADVLLHLLGILANGRASQP